VKTGAIHADDTDIRQGIRAISVSRQ